MLWVKKEKRKKREEKREKRRERTERKKEGRKETKSMSKESYILISLGKKKKRRERQKQWRFVKMASCKEIQYLKMGVYLQTWGSSDPKAQRISTHQPAGDLHPKTIQPTLLGPIPGSLSNLLIIICPGEKTGHREKMY